MSRAWSSVSFPGKGEEGVQDSSLGHNIGHKLLVLLPPLLSASHSCRCNPASDELRVTSRARVHVFLSEENSAAGLNSIIHWSQTPGSRECLGLVCQQPVQWAKPPAQLLTGVLKVGSQGNARQGSMELSLDRT